MARAVVAAATLAAGSWAVGHKFSTVRSIEGVMDARLIVLRSPVVGVIKSGHLQAGSTVSAGQDLLEISNTSRERDTAHKTEMDAAAAAEQVRSLREAIGDFEKLETKFAAEAVEYQKAAIHRAELLVSEAQAQKQVAAVNVSRTHDEEVLTTRMFEAHSAGAIEELHARSASQVAKQELTAAQGREERAQAQLDAARRGVYLDDPAGSAPYAQQRLDEVRIRLAELRNKLTDQQTDLERLQKLIAYEQNLAKARDAVAVASPSSGVLWEDLATPGSSVTEDQALATVLDPGQLFAVAVFDGKYQRSCTPGAQVTVRFAGSREWLPGSVESVVGGSARLEGQVLAASLPVVKSTAKEGGKLVAIVSVTGLPSDPDQRRALIGRRLEVRLKRDTSGWHGVTDLFLPD